MCSIIYDRMSRYRYQTLNLLVFHNSHLLNNNITLYEQILIDLHEHILQLKNLELQISQFFYNYIWQRIYDFCLKFDLFKRFKHISFQDFHYSDSISQSLIDLCSNRCFRSISFCQSVFSSELYNYKKDTLLSLIENNIITAKEFTFYYNYNTYYLIYCLAKSLINNKTLNRISIDCFYGSTMKNQKIMKNAYTLFDILLNLNVFIFKLDIYFPELVPYDARYYSWQTIMIESIEDKCERNRNNHQKKSATFLSLVSQHLTF